MMMIVSETDGGGSLLKIIDSSSSVKSWSKKIIKTFAQGEENPYKKWVVQYFGEEIKKQGLLTILITMGFQIYSNSR